MLEAGGQGVNPIRRVELISQAEEILDFFDVYDALKHEHLEIFFPNSRKVVSYLIKKKRLHKSPDGAYISTIQDPRIDKCLLAALGVLADVFEKVQSYAKATAPAQISFVTHSKDYYEIVYIGYGMETMVTASLEAQLAMKLPTKGFSNAGTGAVKHMVIIEDKSQMGRLQIPGIVRFALVHPNGSFTYFRGD